VIRLRRTRSKETYCLDSIRFDSNRIDRRATVYFPTCSTNDELDWTGLDWTELVRFRLGRKGIYDPPSVLLPRYIRVHHSSSTWESLTPHGLSLRVDSGVWFHCCCHACLVYCFVMPSWKKNRRDDSCDIDRENDVCAVLLTFLCLRESEFPQTNERAKGRRKNSHTSKSAVSVSIHSTKGQATS